MTFADLGLGEDILRAIGNAGYTTPTPIQAQAIPLVLTGRDVMGCAQTGTGKTASFTLPMIEILAAGRARARMPRSLILEPTRELAAQVQENFVVYGAQHRLTTALLIGGESMAEQTKKLDRGVDVLIATPGRLIDQFERGNILLSDIKVLVIDECDRMLDMGFIPDIEKIVARLPKIRQTLMFSATMPPEIRRLADNFLSNPKEVSVAPPASPAASVQQTLIHTDEHGKRDVLRHLLSHETVKNALIFCNRKREVARLHKVLERLGLNAGALHGDMAQSARTETLDRFKKGELTLLVCSDVAARGLDIQGLSHVFNYDVPMHAEDYVHRIGRTGRAGKSGRAFTLATDDDAKALAGIEKLIGKAIPRETLDGEPTDAPPPPAVDAEGPRKRGARDKDRRGRRDEAGERREPRAPASQPAPSHPGTSQPGANQPGASQAPAGHAPARRGAEPQPEPRRAPDGPQRGGRGRWEPSRPDRGRYRDEPPDEPVVGFGDDLPAFLRAAPPKRKAG